MVWLIVAVAIVVLGLAAWAGAGHLGQLPPVVDDRPKGFIPDGEVNAEFLEKMRLPTSSTGYSRTEVDDLLAEVVNGAFVYEPRFTVESGGYNMQAVDAVLDRLLAQAPARRAAEPSPTEAQVEAEPGTHVPAPRIFRDSAPKSEGVDDDALPEVQTEPSESNARPADTTTK